MAVYLIRNGDAGAVKIGHTNGNPLARLRSLQTSMPTKLRLIRVLKGGVAEERALHGRFAALRLEGEWFKFAPEMLDADLGLEDLPIPTAVLPSAAPFTPRFIDTPFPTQSVKTANGPDHMPATKQWLALEQELLGLIGGKEAVAQALGIAPWHVTFLEDQDHSQAILVLARQRGCTMRLDDLLALKARVRVELRQMEAANARFHQDQGNRQREAEWKHENPGRAAWWDSNLDDAPSDAA